VAESVAPVCYAPSEPGWIIPAKGSDAFTRRSTPPFSPLETIRKELLDFLELALLGGQSRFIRLANDIELSRKRVNGL
jgi:hypothetical protein